MKLYTVKQLSQLACVTVRTLHYYDQIDLLKPSATSGSGYRYYDEQAILRLQQILFYRELGFSLDEIRAILDSPQFDLLNALEAHKSALQQQVARLTCLIHTVDQTIHHIESRVSMKDEELFEGFSEAKQKEYEKEIGERWGDEAFDNTVDWHSYSKAKQETIKAEGKSIYRDLVAVMNKGAVSGEVQAIIARWHQHLRYFYEPSTERLLGLADLYNDHPDFFQTFQRLHPDLPGFLREAIKVYCAKLPPTINK